MKQNELAVILPWTNRFPPVLNAAELFSEEEWLAMDAAGLCRFFEEFTEPMLIPLMLDAIKMSPQIFAELGCTLVMNNASADNNEILFQDAVFYKLKETAAALRKHPAGTPTVVMQWLGDDLFELFDTVLLTYGAKDDLIQWLSNASTRAILEGNADTENLPPQVRQLGKKDIRTLLRNKEMTPDHFLRIVKALAKPVTRSLPDWVGNMSDNKQIASCFTDEQLKEIGSYLKQKKEKYDEAGLNTFLRLVSLKLDEALLTGMLSQAGFNDLLKKETTDLNPESSQSVLVSSLENQLLSHSQQNKLMPRIPTQAYLLVTFLMAARIYVAWHSTENSSFAFKCLQSMLQLRGPSNKVVDIAQSALLGAAGIFVCLQRGLQPSQNNQETEDRDCNNVSL